MLSNAVNDRFASTVRTRYAGEREKLPVLTNRCPADHHTKREEIKELVYELSGRYPELKEHIFGAMQRLPLPEWGVAEHRRPLPDLSEEQPDGE